MTRIEKALNDKAELEAKGGLVFEYPDSPVEGSGPSDVVTALHNGQLYCIIENTDEGWSGRLGEHMVTASHPTLEMCVETIRQRYQTDIAYGDFERRILKRWDFDGSICETWDDSDCVNDEPGDFWFSDFEKQILKQWGEGDYSVEPYVSNLIGKMSACEEEEGYGVIVNVYYDNLVLGHVFDLNNKPLGVFTIPDKKPSCVNDIVEYLPEKFCVLSFETKKKILNWLRDEDSDNWEFWQEMIEEESSE